MIQALRAALALALLLAPHAGAEDLGRARLPERESASEFWTLAARLDSGDLLFVEIGITNVGVGDRNGVAVAHWIGADGRSQEFTKARREKEWELSEDRLRIDVGPVALDLRGPVHRLQIDRDAWKVDLRFGPGAPAAAPGELAGAGHGFALLRAGARADGTVWLEGRTAPAPVTGTVALTHRWVDSLESRVVLRRIELFSLHDGEALYLVETTGPDGSARRWARVEREGRVMIEEPVELALEWSADDAGGFALPRGLRLESENLTGRVDFGALLIRYDPLRDLPMPLRIGLAPWLRWRIAWSSSNFDVRWKDDGGEARVPHPTAAGSSATSNGAESDARTSRAATSGRIVGTGIANVTYFNPFPPALASGKSGECGQSGGPRCASEF